MSCNCAGRRILRGCTRKKLKQLYEELFYTLDTEQKIEKVAVRYAKRRLDRLLKRIDVEQSADLESLSKEFESRFKSINISEIAQEAAVALRRAVRERNAEELLFWYDNKGLMELAARHLKSQKKKDFESWVMRVLKNNTAPRVRDAIKRSLPEMHPN